MKTSTRRATISHTRTDPPEGAVTFPSPFGELTLERGLTRRGPAPDGREPRLMPSKRKYRA